MKPKHYEYKYDVVDLCRDNDVHFFVANFLKYLLRYERKNGVDDLNKAIFYLEEIERFALSQTDMSYIWHRLLLCNADYNIKFIGWNFEHLNKFQQKCFVKFRDMSANKKHIQMQLGLIKDFINLEIQRLENDK